MSVWHEIADRVWVRRYRFYDQTIGVVGGDDGLLVIDTRSSHRQAEELRSDLAELPGAVRWVVNTHHHHDHCFGNHVFRDAEIWGQTLLPDPARRARRPDERGARATTWPTGPTSGARSSSRRRPARSTSGPRSTSAVASVELHHLGRGHTDNDIVLAVPDAGVLFAGDLLENGAAPYFGDGYPLDWPATVEALIGLGATTIAPGHGEVADRAFAERSLEEIRTIADLGRSVAAGALSVDEAIARSPYKPKASREPHRTSGGPGSWGAGLDP